MGILTNLLEDKWRRDDADKRTMAEMYKSIIGNEDLDPSVRERGLNEFGKLLGKGGGGKAGGGAGGGGGKAGAGEIVPIFKKLLGLDKGKPQDQGGQGGQQGLSEVLGARPGASHDIPAPPGMPSVVGGGKAQIPPVHIFKSPEEQFKEKLDQAKQEARMKMNFANQSEVAKREIESETKQRDLLREEETKRKISQKQYDNYQALVKGGYKDEDARNISGYHQTEKVNSVAGLVLGTDPQLQAWGKSNGIAIDPNKEYHALRDQFGNISQAFEAPAATGKGPNGLSGTLKSDAEAQYILDHKDEYDSSTVTAAKNYLTKQNRPPSTITNLGEAKSEASAIAQGIMNGDQPPVLTGLGRGGVAPEVRKILEQKGFNLSKATTDWTAVQAGVRSMNGAQQLRLREATNFSIASLDKIDNRKSPGNDLIGQLRRFIPRTKFPILNKVALEAAKQGVFGDAAASAAVQLESQVADLQFELGTVYMGGNSPTDRGLGKAQSMLKGEWSENVLRDAVDLARGNLGYRLNSITQIQAAGVSPDSPYQIPRPPAENVDPSPTNRAGGTGPDAIAKLPKPPKPGASIDAETAKKYIQAAGGDKDKARELITKDGWKIPK